MKRLGTAIAAGLLIGLTACGGGSDEPEKEPKAETSPSLALLTTAQACAQVQMVNEELDGPGRWPIPTYGRFGEETSSLAGESDPEIASALKAMSDQAVKVGGMSTGGDEDVTVEAGEWATLYQAVADICARTDSPIGRLP